MSHHFRLAISNIIVDRKSIFISYSSILPTGGGAIAIRLKNTLQLVGGVEVLKSLLDAGGHGLLSLANPDTWVEVLLVWLVLAIWVTNLLHDVVLLVQDVVTDTGEVSVLEVSVQVDLDNTVGDGLLELVLGGSGSTVEDEEDWLVLLGTDGGLDVGLVLAKKRWLELDVSWLVDTVDVSETGGNGEVWGDWGEGLVDVEDVLWLGVEGVVVDVLVVDAILLTSGDTDLHLEPLLHWSSALEVLSGGLDVVVNLLLREIDHVGREEWLAVGLEVSLIGIKETIQPWEELLGAVIGVEDDWDAVCWGNGADVLSTGNTSSNGSLLLIVGNTLVMISFESRNEEMMDSNLSGEVCGTTLGHLEDDWGLRIASSLEGCNDGRRRGDVLMND